jgi:hypothetical protein
VLLVLGALISNRWNCCKKNHVCQVRGRISQLDVGRSTQTIFSRYIAGCLVGLDHLVVDFG